MSTTAPAKPSSSLVQKIATPLTIVTFVISGITGLALFFEFRSRSITVIHEWLSVLFVVASALHCVRNWRPLLHQMKRAVVWGPVLAVTVFLLLLVWMGPPRSEHIRHGHGPMPVESGPAPAGQAK